MPKNYILLIIVYLFLNKHIYKFIKKYALKCYFVFKFFFLDNNERIE